MNEMAGCNGWPGGTCYARIKDVFVCLLGDRGSLRQFFVNLNLEASCNANSARFPPTHAGSEAIKKANNSLQGRKGYWVKL